jgi:SAM-dependent methyltransferase
MRKIHKGKILDKKDGFSVIDCVSCGFKHIDPLPSDEEVSKLYKQDFYSKEKPSYFKNAKEDFLWWMATYNNYYSTFEKYTKGRKILDIGSGPGDFLVCGRKRGWKVLGVEPSTAAWKYSKKQKLSVVNDFFTYKAMKQYGLFDVIHASMVLEHVSDPVSFIKDMKELLKPSGLLVIYCPNDYNPLQETLRKKLKFQPWWVVPKHHLNYFDLVSMEKLLNRLGFDKLEALGTFPMELFLLGGVNYVVNSKLGKKCHKIRKVLEMSMYKNCPEVLNSLYSSLIEKNIGRSFLLVAKKSKF